MQAAGISSDDFLRYHIQQMEVHRYLLELDQDAVGAKFVTDAMSGQKLPVPLHPELGACVICDIRGASVTSFWEASQVVSQMIDIDKTNYYGTMDQMLIINAPFAFSIAWNFVKPLLDPVTRDAIHVMSGDAYKALLKYVDDDNIPPEFKPHAPPRHQHWPHDAPSASIHTSKKKKKSKQPKKGGKKGKEAASIPAQSTQAAAAVGGGEVSEEVAVDQAAEEKEIVTLSLPDEPGEMSEGESEVTGTPTPVDEDAIAWEESDEDLEEGDLGDFLIFTDEWGSINTYAFQTYVAAMDAFDNWYCARVLVDMTTRRTVKTDSWNPIALSNLQGIVDKELELGSTSDGIMQKSSTELWQSSGWSSPGPDGVL